LKTQQSSSLLRHEQQGMCALAPPPPAYQAQDIEQEEYGLSAYISQPPRVSSVLYMDMSRLSLGGEIEPWRRE